LIPILCAHAAPKPGIKMLPIRKILFQATPTSATGRVMKHPVSFLRSVGLLEAISYLILLFVAMPLKYAWGMPVAVKIVGSVHGGLFVLFCIALWRVLMHTGWPFSRAVLVFFASLLPFVPFFIDRRMRAWAAEDSNQTPA